MPRYTEWDRETAICEHTAKCYMPAVNQFKGGPCISHEEAYEAKRKAKNAKAKVARQDKDYLMSSLGLNKVKVNGKVFYE